MTATERKAAIETELAYMLERGERQYDVERFVYTYADKFGGVWFYVPHRDRYIALITANKGTVHVRANTSFKPLFKEYAESRNFRLLERPQLQPPRYGLPNVDSFTSILLARQAQVVSTATHATSIISEFSDMPF